MTFKKKTFITFLKEKNFYYCLLVKSIPDKPKTIFT